MRKRMIIVVAALAAVLGSVFGYKAFIGYMTAQALAEREAPPVVVGAVPPEVTDWQETLNLTGQLRAVQQVVVSTEAAGIVRKITFKSGTEVSEGDLLVALDTESDKAELAALRADAQLAKITVARERELRTQELNSRAELDRAESEYNRAQARVDAKRAMIAKKTIRAPFSGKLGIRRVDTGQYLGPGTEIVTLQQLAPIYADFDLPQRRIADVTEGQRITLQVAGYEEPFEGRIEAISPELDRSTRTFTARARFANADRKLRPGMFGGVKVEIGEPEPFITLRQTAISYNPFGDAVWVVNENDEGELTATRRAVKTGRTRGDQVQILSGISEDERVVVIGHHKLRQGSRVKIDNGNLPANEADPGHVENR